MKQKLKLTKFVEAQITMTSNGDSNTEFSCIKFVSFESIIAWIILRNL